MSTTISNTKTTSNLIQVRIPADLKERTAKLFEELGTTTSDVIRMMLVRADETHSIPFPIRTEAYPYTPGERIAEVATTFKLEDMPLSVEDIEELKAVETARTTTEELRQKTLAEFKKKYGE